MRLRLGVADSEGSLVALVTAKALHPRTLEGEVFGIEHLGREDRLSPADGDVFANVAEKNSYGLVGFGLGDFQELAVLLARFAFGKSIGSRPEHASFGGGPGGSSQERAPRWRMRKKRVTPGSNGEHVDRDVFRGRSERQRHGRIARRRRARGLRARLVDERAAENARTEHRLTPARWCDHAVCARDRSLRGIVRKDARLDQTQRENRGEKRNDALHGSTIDQLITRGKRQVQYRAPSAARQDECGGWIRGWASLPRDRAARES